MGRLLTTDYLGAKRVLFVAHREEILRQSRDVFRAVLPDRDAGLFTGDERALDSDVLMASVQSPGRNLHRWAADSFDLVVVDEFQAKVGWFCRSRRRQPRCVVIQWEVGSLMCAAAGLRGPRDRGTRRCHGAGARTRPRRSSRQIGAR